MIDILDILSGRASQTNPATYYPTKPEAILYVTQPEELYLLDHGGLPIDVEILDPESYSLRQLFSDVTDKGRYTAVKTRDQNDYKIGGYIAMADGTLYIIDVVTVDKSSASKQAMRFNPLPLGTEFILRLIEVENERGLT